MLKMLLSAHHDGMLTNNKKPTEPLDLTIKSI